MSCSNCQSCLCGNNNPAMLPSIVDHAKEIPAGNHFLIALRALGLDDRQVLGVFDALNTVCQACIQAEFSYDPSGEYVIKEEDVIIH